MAMIEWETEAHPPADKVVFDVLREGRIIKVILNLKKPKTDEKGKSPAPGV